MIGINPPKHCPECNAALLFDGEWFVSKRNTGSAVDGRLRMRDIAVDFVFGCGECSATVLTVPADKIAKSMTEGGF
jgi:hypothetical protein